MYVVIAWPSQSFTNLYSENKVDKELRSFRDWLKAGAQAALMLLENAKWRNEFVFLESSSYLGEPPMTSDLNLAFKFQTLRKAEELQKQVENSRVLSTSQAEQYVAKRGY